MYKGFVKKSMKAFVKCAFISDTLLVLNGQFSQCCYKLHFISIFNHELHK